MAKSIMIQGTMSNAGKSLICAGLCRVFKQDGYRVAPFKSQNMALNSFITSDNLEIGRAQAVQAEACGILPDVRMNPILLKPTSDIGSQVILNGEIYGNMKASEYFALKRALIPDIMKAYDSLSKEYDIIVLEGAGSPAEINLKKDDIVNMGMAKLARAPVILAGDIDRGGVFAQLYGTVALLDDDEKHLIKALIINKFRGDIKLLSSGIEMLEALTRKPVAGIVPHLEVDIDDEDSLSERLNKKNHNKYIDIAVIRLPRISNFTDFSALQACESIGVRYVDKAVELGNPDMIIIPGTKNTISDLKWLRNSSLEEEIKKLSDSCVVFGICGGYQMLGKKIIDAHGTEGGGEIDGMDLLPVLTEFASEKQRTKIGGNVLEPDGILKNLKGSKISGYEMHMGKSTLLESANPLIKLENGEYDGCFRGNVYGSYLHGFFDESECRELILSALACKKGLTIDAQNLDYKAYKENQYDILAGAIRNSLDMNRIYSILEAGI